MRDFILGPAAIKGRVRLYQVAGHPGTQTLHKVQGESVDPNALPFVQLPGEWNGNPGWSHNDILYDWASIVSRQLADGGTAYRIGGMYIEYKNVASPNDAVAAPAFDRTGGIGYYNGLAGSPDVDYLRVPLIAAVRSSSDPELFPDGNRVTFFAQTQGVVGVHGRAFSDVVNSKVYGAALVAIPDAADRTKDLVLSRLYVPANKQQVKLATSQIGPEWEITLG